MDLPSGSLMKTPPPPFFAASSASSRRGCGDRPSRSWTHRINKDLATGTTVRSRYQKRPRKDVTPPNHPFACREQGPNVQPSPAPDMEKTGGAEGAGFLVQKQHPPPCISPSHCLIERKKSSAPRPVMRGDLLDIERLYA